MTINETTTLFAVLLVLTLGGPLVLAAALIPTALIPTALIHGVWRAGAIRVAAWAALPALLLVALIPVGTQVEVPWLLLGSRFGVDETGRAFLFVTAVLWLAAGVFAQSYLAQDTHRPSFFAFYLLALCGNLGLILAQDMVSFYLCFALMSFASYGLVVHSLEPDAVRSGRIYMVLVIVGEVMLFAGLVMLATNTGTWYFRELVGKPLNALPMLLIALSFSIKAGALPLHVWLPLAHPAAPVPASAVLSGAMIKAGLIGWLRFLPLGQSAYPEWGALFVSGGLAAAFYGTLVGIGQTNPKTVLAYSSISQMGLMTIGVGVGFLAPEVWPDALLAVTLYAVHHGLAKGALFIGVGVAGTKQTALQRALVGLGLVLLALALAGAPFTSGAIAKTALKATLALLPTPWPFWLATLLPLATVGTTLLMARFLYLAWPRGATTKTLTLGKAGPWAVLILAVATTLWLWPGAGKFAQYTLKPDKLWLVSWPIALGVLASVVVAWLTMRRGWRVPVSIPAGDVLAIAIWVGRQWPRVTFAHAAIPSPAAVRRTFTLDRFGKWESGLRKWSTVGGLVLALTIIVFVLLMSQR